MCKYKRLNFIFMRFMEVWMQRVPCKVNMRPFGRHLLCTWPVAFILPWTLEKWNLFLKYKFAVVILSIRTARFGQTVQTYQSDHQVLHCLPFYLHLLDGLLYDKTSPFTFYDNYSMSNVFKCPNFSDACGKSDEPTQGSSIRSGCNDILWEIY